MNMNILNNGQNYSLNEIFSGDNNKVIIPDLQRDYCWGNKIDKSNDETRVEALMDSIFTLNKEEDITMGIIYGYYDKKLIPYHLQLCDGQQRLTTLFLLIGVLNRLLDNKFKNILISNFELDQDDQEPHLIYSIRESSVYFLSDLTIHYFLDISKSIEEIEKETWFLNSYHTDPTIKSILKALASITNKIDNYTGDIAKLGEYVTERIKFLYYDLNDRQNGEETFVVINTTGEPLSPTQNLKPIIINANPNYKRIEDEAVYTAAMDWENMETWFWRHRTIDENSTQTSTEGMEAFLHCVKILESDTIQDWHENIDISNEKFPISIPMDKIWEWFKAYKKLYETNFDRLKTRRVRYHQNGTTYHYTQKELYAILPAMCFCSKFKEQATQIDIERIFHLCSNMARYRNTTRSSKKESLNVPAFKLCSLVNAMENTDILCLLNNPEFNIEEERYKLEFIKGLAPEDRIKSEETFAKTEDFSIFDGKISTMVSWSERKVDRLQTYSDKIQDLWENSKDINKIRRALLAVSFPGYPMNVGTTNLTLCSDGDHEWRTLFERQSDAMKNFIDTVNVDECLNSFNDESSKFYMVITKPEILEYCQKQCIRIYPNDVIEIMAKERESSEYNLIHRRVIYNKYMVDKIYWDGFWIWPDGNTSVFYSRSNKFNLTLNMRIEEYGYTIVAIQDRNPKNPLIDINVLYQLGFQKNNENELLTLYVETEKAKQTFIEITKVIDDTCK